MDVNRFNEACMCITGAQREREGIGTLGEKTLHAILKLYCEGDTAFHEIKVGRWYADICRDGDITEIQTANFNTMRGKLRGFLPDHKVRIVFPVAYKKRICWLEPGTGEMSKPRLSSKKGSPADIFPELYKIKMFLLDPNISFCIMLLDINEYRLLDGWGRGGKRGSTRFERIPSAIVGEIEICSPADYRRLIPAGLPEHFDARDFAHMSKRSVYRAQTALNVLNHVGAVRRVGKSGNAFIYEAALPGEM